MVPTCSSTFGCHTVFQELLFKSSHLLLAQPTLHPFTGRRLGGPQRLHLQPGCSSLCSPFSTSLVVLGGLCIHAGGPPIPGSPAPWPQLLVGQRTQPGLVIPRNCPPVVASAGPYPTTASSPPPHHPLALALCLLFSQLLTSSWLPPTFPPIPTPR